MTGQPTDDPDQCGCPRKRRGASGAPWAPRCGGPRACSTPAAQTQPTTCPHGRRPRDVQVRRAPLARQLNRLDSRRFCLPPPPRLVCSPQCVQARGASDGPVSRKIRTAGGARLFARRHHPRRAHRLACRADRDPRRSRQRHRRQFRRPDEDHLQSDRQDAAPHRRHARQHGHHDGVHQRSAQRRSLCRTAQGLLPGRQLSGHRR